MDKERAAKLLTQIREKAAGEPVVADPVLELRRQQYPQVRQQALRNMASLGLQSLGLGAAVRGAVGLSHMFDRDVNQEEVSPGNVEMPVMLHSRKKKPVVKAGDVDNAIPTEPIGIRWYAPGMAASAGLGAIGGWKGVDLIMDNQRKKKTEAELAQARQEYQNALMSSYKTAEDSIGYEVGRQLDRLYDLMLKNGRDESIVGSFVKSLGRSAYKGVGDLNQAFDKEFPNAKGMGVGAYGLYALPAAVTSYSLVDSMMRKGNRRDTLAKAMRERARRQAAMRPTEIYAVPVGDDEET